MERHLLPNLHHDTYAVKYLDSKGGEPAVHAQDKMQSKNKVNYSCGPFSLVVFLRVKFLRNFWKNLF